jgi:hypothetical protein
LLTRKCLVGAALRISATAEQNGRDEDARLSICSSHGPPTLVSKPILGGAGNFDDNVISEPAGEYRALALRRYSERERR